VINLYKGGKVQSKKVEGKKVKVKGKGKREKVEGER